LVAVGVDPHLDRVGVAEQVVDVAEDLLVRADQEEPEAVASPGFNACIGIEVSSASFST
jgi:hypothetical protein